MRRGWIAAALGLAAAALSAGTLRAAEQQAPWKAELEVGNPEAVLGEEVYVKIEITNTSGAPGVMPYPFSWAPPPCVLDIEPLDQSYRDQFREELGRVSRNPFPVVVSKCTYAQGETTTLGWNGVFEAQRVGLYQLRYRCEVSDESVRPEVNPDTKQLESNDEVWRGSFTSNSVMVTVSQPEGIDAEAFDALNKAPSNPRSYSELLGRFPASTYAAYVIWAKWARGWAAVETERAVAALQLGFIHEKGLIWCDAATRLTPGAETRLSGSRYVECRDAWLNLALDHHPDIWFADEVRLKLALDEYLLGHHAASQAGLEGLAEHGRPDVAAKAADILTAMRAKGMLEGTEPAPAAAPVADPGAPVPAPDPASTAAPDPVPAPAAAPAPGADR